MSTQSYIQARKDAQKFGYPFLDDHGRPHNVRPVITVVPPLTDRQIAQLREYRIRRHLWIAERDLSS